MLKIRVKINLLILLGLMQLHMQIFIQAPLAPVLFSLVYMDSHDRLSSISVEFGNVVKRKLNPAVVMA